MCVKNNKEDDFLYTLTHAPRPQHPETGVRGSKQIKNYGHIT